MAGESEGNEPRESFDSWGEPIQLVAIRWQASHQEDSLRLARTERVRTLQCGLPSRFRLASDLRHSTSGVLAGGLNDHVNNVSS
jgi:hypothetical protein